MDSDDDNIVDRLKREARDLQNDLNIMEAEKMEIELELHHLKSVENDRQTEMSRLRLRVRKAERESQRAQGKYRGLLDELNLSGDELQRVLVKYREERDQLEDDLQNQKNSYRQATDLLERDKKVLADDLQDRQQELSELTQKLNEERRRREDAIHECDDLRSRVESLEREIDSQKLRASKEAAEKTAYVNRLSDQHHKTQRLKNDLKRERRKSRASKDLNHEDMSVTDLVTMLGHNEESGGGRTPSYDYDGQDRRAPSPGSHSYDPPSRARHDSDEKLPSSRRGSRSPPRGRKSRDHSPAEYETPGYVY